MRDPTLRDAAQWLNAVAALGARHDRESPTSCAASTKATLASRLWFYKAGIEIAVVSLPRKEERDEAEANAGVTLAQLTPPGADPAYKQRAAPSVEAYKWRPHEGI